MQTTTMNRSLQQAVRDLQAGHTDQARHLLEDVLRDDPRSERAWLWLSGAVGADEERRFCLDQVLSINPRNATARRGLQALGEGPARSPLNGRAGGGEAEPRPLPAPTRAAAAVRRNPQLLAMVYLFALTAAEFWTLVITPGFGLWVNSALLAILIVHTALIWRRPYYKLFLSLTMVPLVRLVSLSMPLAGLPLIYWYLVTSVPLVVSALMVARAAGFSARQIGLTPRGLPIQLAVAGSGLLFGYAEYRLLGPDLLVQANTWAGLLFPALILLLCTGFVEELIFRGVMQRAAREALGDWALWYVAALFAMLHMGHAVWLDIPFVFVVAMFFAWVVAKTRSIVGVTVAHGLTNIMLFLIMPALSQGLGG